MAKWLTILLIMVGNLVFADTNAVNTQQHSNSSYIILAVVALLAIIYILYRRQKENLTINGSEGRLYLPLFSGSRFN